MAKHNTLPQRAGRDAATMAIAIFARRSVSMQRDAAHRRHARTRARRDFAY
jgi:hypothetical protein